MQIFAASVGQHFAFATGRTAVLQQLLLAPDLSLDAKNAILGIGTSLLDMADAATAATRPIGELIEQLTGTRAGLATPQQALQAARDAYQRDLSLAMGGDADALGRITARATEYLDAQKAFSASSDITQTVIDRVIGDLSGLQGSVGSARQPAHPLGQLVVVERHAINARIFYGIAVRSYFFGRRP